MFAFFGKQLSKFISLSFSQSQLSPRHLAILIPGYSYVSGRKTLIAKKSQLKKVKLVPMVFFVEVGPVGAIKGRLPNNWDIIAEHDPDEKTIYIKSPETRDVSITIYTPDIPNLSSSYQPTSDVIDDKKSKVEVFYNEDTGVLRYDSLDTAALVCNV